MQGILEKKWQYMITVLLCITKLLPVHNPDLYLNKIEVVFQKAKKWS